eukprot:scaffold11474_cov148-Skeletonema_menzelii.AAC.1
MRAASEACWDNYYPEEKIARLFIYQTNVAAAVHECNEGDDFVQQKNGFSYHMEKDVQAARSIM